MRPERALLGTLPSQPLYFGINLLTTAFEADHEYVVPKNAIPWPASWNRIGVLFFASIFCTLDGSLYVACVTYLYIPKSDLQQLCSLVLFPASETLWALRQPTEAIICKDGPDSTWKLSVALKLGKVLGCRGWITFLFNRLRSIKPAGLKQNLWCT